MSFGPAFLCALIFVLILRAFAFKGTNSAAFIVDIVLVVYLTAAFMGC
jgi:hypothetical protein